MDPPSYCALPRDGPINLPTSVVFVAFLLGEITELTVILRFGLCEEFLTNGHEVSLLSTNNCSTNPHLLILDANTRSLQWVLVLRTLFLVSSSLLYISYYIRLAALFNALVGLVWKIFAREIGCISFYVFLRFKKLSAKCLALNVLAKQVFLVRARYSVGGKTHFRLGGQNKPFKCCYFDALFPCESFQSAVSAKTYVFAVSREKLNGWMRPQRGGV